MLLSGVCLIHVVSTHLHELHGALKFQTCSERMSVALLNDAEVLTTVHKTLEMQEALSGPVSCYLLTIANQANGLLICTTRAATKAVASLSTRK